MNKCKTCENWLPENGNAGHCTCNKLGGGDFENELPADGLFVGAYDDHLVIITGPDFGCVHYKEYDYAITTGGGGIEKRVH